MGHRVRIDPCSRLPLDALPRDVETPKERALSPYVELTVRSNFSFLKAASPPERLMARAAELGYDAVAITDKDGFYGAVRALEESEKRGVRLVLGVELTLESDTEEKTRDRSLFLHVEDHTGYTNACRLLTISHARHPKGIPERGAKGREARGGGEPLPHPDEEPRNLYAGIDLATVCAHPEGLFATIPNGGLGFSDDDVASLSAAFGERLSIGVHRHEDGVDSEREENAKRLASQFEIALLVTNSVLYAERGEKPILDVLHCIREGCTLEEAGRSLAPNAEAHLKSPTEMTRLFEGEGWERAALARSRDIGDRCRFSLRELKYKFPYEIEEAAFEGETADQALRRLTYVGAHGRYGEAIPSQVEAQIEKELRLIGKLGVAPYFLSTQQIVEMARARDILCQGRGSAANSAVCYCLGVTAVDPASSNLLFERFLSEERHEPPDIDVDFEHERREEVIQDVYAKYGRDRAAMVSEVVCYRGKSALREVGKIFGFTLEQVDRLSSVVSWFDPVRDVDEGRLRDAGFDPKDPRLRMVMTCSQAIQGFPRHLSIHVGGFILSAEPLENVAPVEPATMKDRTVVPWDKDDIDTLGFFKVDCLGLGILAVIRRALALASGTGETRFEGKTAIDRLDLVPREDPEVYDALCKADTVGVFQIESRAQMSMLPRLRPRSFYDLVVEVAIVRPGPIQGGMIHPYLRRRNGEERAESPHPILESILSRTLGVPIFQEQVMQIAIAGAGYSGGEADQLRRDMASWRKDGKLENHRERLLSGFAKSGIAPEFGERLFEQIKGFGEYGFPESHAASFAHLVYASAWLKVHHPAAFAAALVNSQPMGFYSPSTILQDAQRHGVTLLPIDVTESDWDCTLPDKRTLRVGLRQIKGLGEEAGLRIEAERKKAPFVDIEDVAARADLTAGDLGGLAAAGALDALVPGEPGRSRPSAGKRSASVRRRAMWQVVAPRGEGLFAGVSEGDPPPHLPPLRRAEQLALDYQQTGFSVSDHPMKLLRPSLDKSVLSSRDLEALGGDPTNQKRRVVSAGVVLVRQRPQTASGVVFITLEDEHGFINLILWSRIFEQYRYVAVTSGILRVHGKLEADGNVVYIAAEHLEPIVPPGATSFPSVSRDFH